MEENITGEFTSEFVFAETDTNNDEILVGILMASVIVLFLIIIVISHIKGSPLLHSAEMSKNKTRQDRIDNPTPRPIRRQASLSLLEREGSRSLVTSKRSTIPLKRVTNQTPLVPPSNVLEVVETAQFESLTPKNKRKLASSPPPEIDLTRYSIDPTIVESITSRIPVSPRSTGFGNTSMRTGSYQSGLRSPKTPLTSVKIFCNTASESTSGTPEIKTYNL
eukprot:TRINITY_DN326_c3_g1_i1.p1 TRINITY_DN326_c3_g1~~TRINITY_DN326_c3_g1_i1.p1  ORF type:complete len:221 (+),score=33.19 TRINITY_DN326_c3_g1_i1:121-783(+)